MQTVFDTRKFFYWFKRLLVDVNESGEEFKRICEFLFDVFDCDLIWAASIVDNRLQPICAISKEPEDITEICSNERLPEYVVGKKELTIYNTSRSYLQNSLKKFGYNSLAIIPLNIEYGRYFLLLHSKNRRHFCKDNISLLKDTQKFVEYVINYVRKNQDIFAKAELLKTLINSIPISLCIFSSDKKIVARNKFFNKIMNVSDDNNDQLDKLLENRYGFRQFFLDYIGKEKRLEEVYSQVINRDKEGNRIYHKLYVVPSLKTGFETYWTLSITDISKEVDMHERIMDWEEYVRSVEKDRVMNTLIGGIAHELNNPLSYIHANLDTLQLNIDLLNEAASIFERLGESDKKESIRDLVECIEDISDGINRIKKVAKTLTSLFALQDEANLVTIKEIVDLALPTVKPHLQPLRSFSIDIDPTVSVQISSQRMSRAFISLLIASLNTIENKKEGILEITGYKKDGFAHLVIKDNGRPLESSIYGNYSNKVITKRTGYDIESGIFNAQLVLEDYNGTLEVINHGEKGGKTFHIRLPLAYRIEKEIPSFTTDLFMLKRRITIVIVDDEPILVKSLKRLLSTHFDVVTFTFGSEVLDYLKDSENPSDIILCDLVLPDMDGAEIYRKFIELRPHLKDNFFFFTGLIPEEKIMHDPLIKGVKFIRKPISYKNLLSLILQQVKD